MRYIPAALLAMVLVWGILLAIDHCCPGDDARAQMCCERISIAQPHVVGVSSITAHNDRLAANVEKTSCPGMLCLGQQIASRHFDGSGDEFWFVAGGVKAFAPKSIGYTFISRWQSLSHGFSGTENHLSALSPLMVSRRIRL